MPAKGHVYPHCHLSIITGRAARQCNAAGLQHGSAAARRPSGGAEAAGLLDDDDGGMTVNEDRRSLGGHGLAPDLAEATSP